MSASAQSDVYSQLSDSTLHRLSGSSTMMTQVYSIACQKGGVGKTSTAISLAAGLARKGNKILLVDMDSQANASKVLLKNYQQLRKEETVYGTILKRGKLPIHPTSIDT